MSNQQNDLLNEQIAEENRMEHTKLPWKRSWQPILMFARSLTSYTQGESWKWRKEGEFEEAVESNLNYLLNAVNNHENLVHGMKWLIAGFEGKMNQEEIVGRIQFCKEALAKISVSHE